MTSLMSLVSLRNCMTQANYVRVYYTGTFKMKLRNRHIYMYCIVRSVNISITRITRVNNMCFCYVATSDDISTHAGA